MSYYSSSSKKKTETTSSGASGKAVASRTAWGEFQKQLKSDEMKLLASRKSPILTNTVVSSKPSSSADYSREVCLEGGNSSEQAEALLAMGMALNSVVDICNLNNTFLSYTYFNTLMLKYIQI